MEWLWEKIIRFFFLLPNVKTSNNSELFKKIFERTKEKIKINTKKKLDKRKEIYARKKYKKNF